MATVRFSPGDVLRGKYKIKRVLGEGGMGVVVRATHLRLEQDVAIKMLREEGASNPHVVERFAREARAAARLRGEHAVRILDVDDGVCPGSAVRTAGETPSRLRSRAWTVFAVTTIAPVPVRAESALSVASSAVVWAAQPPAAMEQVMRAASVASLVENIEASVAARFSAGGDLFSSARAYGSLPGKYRRFPPELPRGARRAARLEARVTER